MKTPIPSFFIALVLPLACVIGPMPTAHAVTPAPDGCYPGFTTAEGCNALSLLTTGAGNTGLGWRSLFANTTGSFNTGVGAGTLVLNNADSNTAVGAAALLLNTSGTENVAVGTDTMVYNDTGSFNTANGAFALFSNTTGTENTATGDQALYSNTNGAGNTAFGRQALLNTTGSGNTAIGDLAGNGLTTGGSDVYIGAAVATGTTSESNTIRIADNLPTVAGQSACHIGGIAGQTVDPSGAGTVYIDNSGKLGVFLSSRRYKRDIEPMNKASDAIFSLKPVTFHYKSDAKNTPCFGLIAEEVAKVNPDLVVRDNKGELLSVRYDQVNAMLLNEFLKEHRTVQEQGAMIVRQQKQIDVLTAGLQKVSAQLELGKPAPQTVLNNQ